MGHIALLPEERAHLERRFRSRSLRADDSRRARLILMLADGESYLSIRTVLKCNANYVSRWRARFEEDRLAGLFSRRGGAHLVLTPALEAPTLEKTLQAPGYGSTHWTTRKLPPAQTPTENPSSEPGTARATKAPNEHTQKIDPSGACESPLLPAREEACS